MTSLSEEQKDLLVEVVFSDAWPVILMLCDDIVQEMGQRVLSERSTDQELIKGKSRYEGAQALVTSLKALKEGLRKQR